MDRTPVIAGIGLSDYPVAKDLDSVQHHALAMQRALADCGVEKSAIDAYIGAGGSHQMMVDDPVTLAEYFRIDHNYIDGTMTGGSSFEFHVQHGAAAIREGLCDTILLTYGSDQLSRMGRMLGTGGFTRGTQKVGGPQAYEAPYGNSLVGSYAMAAQRHMHEYGTTSEQLGEIAAGVREFAGLNPNAMYRDPITAEDVVSSRMIADPLHKLDCCVISDGGGALIMTTAERAKDLKQPPAYVLGAAGCGARRDRHDQLLRQLHDHRAVAARGPRVLPQGRGRQVRAGGPPAPGRRPAAQHRRRRPVVVPPGDARDLPADRERAAAAGPGGRGA